MRRLLLALTLCVLSALPAQAQFVTDTFTGSNGTELSAHTGETGATWTNDNTGGGGTYVIDTNRIYPAGGAIYHASGSPASADYTVEADVVFLSTAVSAGVGGRLVINNAATGNVDGYVCQHRSFHQWQLIRLDNGSTTQLGVDSGSELVAGTVRVKLSMVSSAIKCYVDGVETVSATDATWSAAGKAGVVAFNGAASTSTGYHLDNFAATNVGTPARPKLTLLGVGP